MAILWAKEQRKVCWGYQKLEREPCGAGNSLGENCAPRPELHVKPPDQVFWGYSQKLESGTRFCWEDIDRSHKSLPPFVLPPGSLWFGLATKLCPTLVTPWAVAARLFCPWNSPGNYTGVGCQFLLQGVFPTQESNPVLLHCGQILYRLSYREDILVESIRKPSGKWWICFSITGQASQEQNKEEWVWSSEVRDL